LGQIHQPEGALIGTLVLVRGSLGIFNLVDLIQLLGSNNSRGCLLVHHPEHGDCRTYFDIGRVTHVSYQGVEGVEALKNMLQDERGNFEFLPNLAANKNSVTSSLDNLLLQAIRGLEAEPNREEKQVTPPNELDTPRVLDMERLSQLTLSSEEFSIIEKVDGKRSTLGIAQASGLPYETVVHVLVRLAGLGLVDIKRRDVRIAQLVIGMSREISGSEACIDQVIVKTWERQTGRKVRGVRIREASGREIVFPSITRIDLGAYLLLSSSTIVRFGLQAGRSVLAKPEH
jgi:hypothetical protein